MREMDAKRQAFGVSHNLFDVSSYGEVRMAKMLRDAAQTGNVNQTASLCQMQDKTDNSIAFDDLKFKKKQTGVEPIEEEVSAQESMTNKFEQSSDHRTGPCN